MLRQCSTITIYLSLGLLLGCGASSGRPGSQNLYETARKVKTDDNEQRVIELLGQPDRKSETSNGTKWHYESTVTNDDGSSSQVKVRLIVKNGAVIAISLRGTPIK